MITVRFLDIWMECILIFHRIKPVRGMVAARDFDYKLKYAVISYLISKRTKSIFFF